MPIKTTVKAARPKQTQEDEWTPEDSGQPVNKTKLAVKDMAEFFDKSLQGKRTVATAAKPVKKKLLPAKPPTKLLPKKPSVPKLVEAKPVAKPKKGEKLPPDLNKVRGTLLTASLRAAQLEYKDPNIVAAGQLDKLMMGLPIPLPIEYLLQQNVWPLSCIFQFVGEPGCNKTALGFEVMRWFDQAKGLGYLFENEVKISMDLFKSVCGYSDETFREFMIHVRCYSLEDWQQKLQSQVRNFKQLMDKKTKTNPKPCGRVFPILFLLDSISGQLTEEKQDKIEQQGFAERSFALEAMKNQDLIKKLAPDLSGWPFSFVMINHLKKRKADRGPQMLRQKPGGTHISFAEAIEIELTKLSRIRKVDTRKDAISMEMGGNQLKLQIKKSSLGQDERDVRVAFMWRYDPSPVDGRVRQYSWWDWDGATVDLLLGQEGSGKKKAMGVVDVNAVTMGKETMYWSKRLSISKAKPVSKSEIGAAIQNNEEVRDDLRDLFGIKRLGVYQTGTDYYKVIKQRLQEAEKYMV